MQQWRVGPVAVVLLLLLLGRAMMAHADHPDPAAEDQDSATARPAKATLGVGITLDAEGRLWLARVENRQLLVSRSDDDGKTFSTPVPVTVEPEDIAADGENRPKLAVASDGTLLLTWIQSLPQKYAGNVRFSRSLDGGRTFSRPITLNDDGRVTSHRFDALAIDGQGRVVVAWLDGRDRDAAKERNEAFTGVSLYTAHSSDNGASFGANRRLQAHTCECCRIGLTWTQEGPVAFWRNIFGVNTRDFALANLDRDGSQRRATDDEWKIDACPHNGGSIAVDRQDQLHLVWFTSGEARQGLFYRRLKMQANAAAAESGFISTSKGVRTTPEALTQEMEAQLDTQQKMQRSAAAINFEEFQLEQLQTIKKSAEDKKRSIDEIQRINNGNIFEQIVGMFTIPYHQQDAIAAEARGQNAAQSLAAVNQLLQSGNQTTAQLQKSLTAGTIASVRQAAAAERKIEANATRSKAAQLGAQTGDWMSDPMPLGDPAFQANHAAVAAEGKTVLLAWREFDGRAYSAQMMYSNDGGVSWSAPQRLMDSAGATDYPLLLVGGRKVLLVWNTAEEGLRVLSFDRFAAGTPPRQSSSGQTATGS